MTNIAKLCRDVARAPFFVVACIGMDEDRAEQVRSLMEDLGVLKGFYCVDAPADLAELDPALLHVGDLAGCLLVVWDIGGRSVREAVDLLDRVPLATVQMVGVLLAEEDPRLSLKDFLSLVGRDFASCGDFAMCLGSLQKWCGRVTAGTPALDLTLPFLKEPSRWLRGLKHDHIVNTVSIHRASFEVPELWRMQLDIDFIGVVLRNLLCATEPTMAVRGLSAEGGEESPFYKQVYSSPVRIVAPASLAAPLAAEYREGVDFVLYDGAEAGADLLAAATREGYARIFFKAPEMELPKVEMITVGPRELPTVLVAETAPELTWREWQARLADNVVGSYAEAELGTRRSGQRVVSAQRSCWRACAFLSLPALFDRLIHLLEQTHEAVGEDPPSLRQKVFLSLAAIDAARRIYLGEALP